MAKDLLQQLTVAETEAEREAIVLEMRLSVLSVELREAVMVAALPHWFDALYLRALLGVENQDIYADLLSLSIVEQVPSKGYAIHERTRHQLLNNLWQTDPERFRVLSGRAADYCDERVQETDDPEWQAEATYHRLVSNPDAGVDGLRALATKWANYEYHSYDEIERTLRWADEQITAGRLTGVGADWTRLWQAKLSLIYNRPDLANASLDLMNTDAIEDLYLAAEVAQTRGDLFAQTEDHAGMAAAWQRAVNLYKQLPNGQGQLDAYLIMEKMRQHSLIETEAETETATQNKARTSRNELRLIDNIHAAWIEGVLHTAIDEMIDLRMTRSGSQPSNLVYHRGEGMDKPVVTGQRLHDLFAATNQSMLILGAPGSGKTITLLQLLDELLQRARSDAEAPIPLLFNLSSFAAFAQDNKGDFLDWLAEQAYDQYRLKRTITRQQLVGEDNFVLLLDGLDEVVVTQREECVVAINTFVKTHPCGLVVCSRIGDYEALQNDLRVNHALILQPLSNQQIEAFIQQVDGEQASAMLNQTVADWQLREALRSPLLLHLYPQAFAALERKFEEAELTVAESVETRRKALFAVYVETVFVSTTKNNEATNIFKDISVYWLSYLGNRMQQASNSLFFIEEMQPTWLPRPLVRRYRGLYGLFIGLIIGLFVGLYGGLVDGLFDKLIDQMINQFFLGFFIGLKVEAIDGLLIGLFIGLIGGGAAAVTTWLTTTIHKPQFRASIGILTGLLMGVVIVGFSIGLITETELSILFSDGLFDILFLVLFLGFGMIISLGFLSSWVCSIKLQEKVSLLWPTRQRVLYYLKQGGFYALVIGLIVGLVIGLIITLVVGLVIILVYGLIMGLIIGLIGGIIGFVLAFLDTPLVDKRPQPGMGVRASLRNSLRMTFLAGLFFGIPTLLADRAMAANYIFVFLVLVNILPPAFSWFGGLAWCQHWALRIVIARQGWLPLRLVPWLDSMVEVGLLRRVGGGYIFIHRSLLEYFAELEEWQTT